MFAMFGGAPQLEPLSRDHLLSALEGAAQSAPKKRIDPISVFTDLSNNQIPDHDSDAALGLSFLRDRGLPTAEPILLLNGRLVKLGGPNFEQDIMASLSAEVRSVTALVRAGVLTDEDEDPLAAIGNATATFPRYNEALLQPPDAIELVSLRRHAALSGLRWLGTEPVEAEVRGAARAKEEGEEGEEGEGEGGSEGGSEGGEAGEGEEDETRRESFLWPVSQLLIVDLSVASHVALVAHAVQAMEEAAGGRVRIAILHMPTADAHKPAGDSADALRHSRAVAAWEALTTHISPPPGIPSIRLSSLDSARRLLALLLAAAQAHEPITDAMLSHLLPDIFPSSCPLDPSTSLSTRQAHAALLNSLSVHTSPAIIVNGRLVRPDAAAHLDAVDLGLLAEFEYRQRAQAPAAVLAHMQPSGEEDAGVVSSEGAATATGASELKDAAAAASLSKGAAAPARASVSESAEAAAASSMPEKAAAAASMAEDATPAAASARAWRSDFLMLSVASLARGAREAAAGGAADTGFRASDVECGPACVRLPGSGPGEALELVVVLDPLSKQAQRSVPVLMALQSALGLGITLHLNPQLHIDKFPLESFYRYVVSLEPSFDAAGRSRAREADRAVFSALRTPQARKPHCTGKF
jgi:hypothetical protein